MTAPPTVQPCHGAPRADTLLKDVLEQAMRRKGAWLAMRVVSVDEMRAIERRADEQYGLDSPTLMESAGRSVAEALRARLGGDVRGLRIVTLAGPGNNGGDGRVMNRLLSEWGARVTTWRWRDNMMELAGGEKPAGDDLAGLRAGL